LSFIGTFLAIDALIYNILNAAHFVLLLGLLMLSTDSEVRIWLGQYLHEHANLK